MPSYQQDEQNELTVDFGPDSITLILREDADIVSKGREINKQLRLAQYAAKRIEIKEQELENPNLSTDEFNRLTTEIDELFGKADGISLSVNYIYLSARDWKDRYLNRAAEAEGKTLPFTKENIQKIHPRNLEKICVALSKHFGLDVDAQEEKKDVLMLSPEPSQSDASIQTIS